MSRRKVRCLRETYRTVHAIYSESIAALGGAGSRKQLHEATYRKFRDKHRIASQLVIEATSQAWNNRRTMRGREPKKTIVRFDQRLFSFGETRRGNPTVNLRTNHERIGIPIAKGASLYLKKHLTDGWWCSSILMKRDLTLYAVLSKDPTPPKAQPNVLGIDVNSARIALTALSSRKVLRQLYLGQDVATRQFRFEERRAKLQGYRDRKGFRGKAGLKLKRLSGRQRCFVKTRLWMAANEFVTLAKASNCEVAIERLRNLRRHRGEFRKKSSRKTNRIPYGFLRRALRCVCEREGIILREVSGAYTSQTCPRCGFVSRGSWVRYKLFRCVKCGHEANRDRVASLNVALRALGAAPHTAIPRGYVGNQISERNASVSRRVRQDEAPQDSVVRGQVASSQPSGGRS